MSIGSLSLSQIGNHTREGYSISSNSLLKQEVTLIVGSDDDAVKSGASIFKNSLDDDVEINKQNDILSSETNEIIIIFSHGSEKGINMNGELISWYDLSILISQSKADYIFLAACFGAKIYDFVKPDTIKVYGFDGFVDAIIMGYYSALLVNTLFNHNDDADNNFNSLISRALLILEQPGQILPLYCTKCKTQDKYIWIFPIQLSVIYHIKLTNLELAIGGGVTNLIGTIVDLTLSGIPQAILTILLLEIDTVVSVSQIAHSNQGVDGAYVSLMSMLLPATGIWWQARNPAGNIIFQLPINPGDPALTAALGTILRNNLHDWKCGSL